MIINKSILKKYVIYGIASGADEIEIAISKGTTNNIEVRDQKLESSKSATDYGLSVRVIQSKKLGFSYTTSINDVDIKKTIEMAIASTKFTNKDKYLGLTKKQKEIKKSLALYDQQIIKLTYQQRLKQALAIEKTALKFDKRIKKIESIAFESGNLEEWIINSKNIHTYNKSTYCGGSAEVIAQDKRNMESGSHYFYTTHLNDFNAKNVGEKSASNAVSMLGSKKIKSDKQTLLLENIVSIDLLSVLLPMLSAENIQKNKSLLKNKIGKSIASELLTIVDDPFMKKGMGSYLYDSEGVLATKKDMIKDGYLKNYFYDTYTAAKDGVKSTGNASRGSIKVEAGIGPANLYIKPGNLSEKELIKKVHNGLYINNLMGLHMVDTISGNFSLGASGYVIKNGKLGHPVNEIAIAGNLLELLNSITEIGNNIIFLPASGSLGAPSLVIKDIAVSGK